MLKEMKDLLKDPPTVFGIKSAYNVDQVGTPKWENT